MNTTDANITMDAGTGDQVMQAVARARELSLPVIEAALDYQAAGLTLPQPHLMLKQHGRVLEHWISDLTVHVAAGCTLGALRMHLAKQNQWLPIDGDDAMTIGEVIHRNHYGPLRLGFGAMRDLLLGLTFVDGLAQCNKVGGRTVKNVAGYDVTRLLVGAMGQFGIVTEAIVRTYAMPACVMHIKLRLDDPRQLDSQLTDWLTHDAAATWMLLQQRDQHWQLHLAYFGEVHGCEIQLQALTQLVDAQQSMTIIDQQVGSLEDDHQHRAALQQWQRQGRAHVRLVVPPARTGEACARLAAHRDLPMQINALPVHGCLDIGGQLDAGQCRQVEAAIADLLNELPGFRIWHRRPAELQDVSIAWPSQPDTAMLEKIRQMLDPDRILNPGRLLS